MCPWYNLGSASSFVPWLASYQCVLSSPHDVPFSCVETNQWYYHLIRVFLSAITGVMLCHYYLICRGYIQIDSLYDTLRMGPYWYSSGWNYRTYIAYIVGIVPNFYGFLGVFGIHVTTSATRMYYFAYPMGLALSFGTYYALCKINPIPDSRMGQEWYEPDVLPSVYMDGTSDGNQIGEVLGVLKLQGDGSEGVSGNVHLRVLTRGELEV